MITLQDVQEAQRRIEGYVRHTPLVEASPVKTPVMQDVKVYLKLESMQISGSFKARGAVNKLKTLSSEQLERGIVTASGGNHGLGVAYAGWLAKCPATIYLSSNVPPIKAQKLESWGAKIAYAGEVWDDANRAALEAAEGQGLTYIHPFADPVVIAGQGTVALEVLEQVDDLDMMLVAIGGGGLISGVSLAARAINPNIRIIGVEPIGAPTLYESRKAGQVIELETIKTVANTLAPRKSAQINLDIIRECVDDIVLVSDEEMRDAARWLWPEMSIAAELSGSAALAALLSKRINVESSQKICVLVCGAGTDGIEAR